MHARITVAILLLLLLARPAVYAQQSFDLKVVAIDASPEGRENCAIVYRRSTESWRTWTYAVVNTSGVIQAVWPPGVQNRPKQYSPTDTAFVIAAHGPPAVQLSQAKPGWKATFDDERMRVQFISDVPSESIAPAPALSGVENASHNDLIRELAILNGALRTIIDRVSGASRFYPAIVAAALAIVAALLFILSALLFIGMVAVRRWWRSDPVRTAREQTALLLPKLATASDATSSALNRSDPDGMYAQLSAVAVERLMPLEKQIDAILLEVRAIAANTSESTSLVRDLTATRISAEQFEGFGGRLIHALAAAKPADVVPASETASTVDVVSLLISIDASLRSLALRVGATGDSISLHELPSTSNRPDDADASGPPATSNLGDEVGRATEVNLRESDALSNVPDVFETLVEEVAAPVEIATQPDSGRFAPSADAAGAVERFRYICEGSHEPAATKDLQATLDTIADSRSEREFCIGYAQALVKLFYLYPMEVAVEEINRAKLLEGIPLVMDVPKAGSIAPPVGAERFRWNDMPEAYRPKFRRMLESRVRNYTLANHVVCVVRPKLTYRPGGLAAEGDVLQKPAILLLQDVQDILSRAKTEL